MADIQQSKVVNHFYTSNTYIISNEDYNYVWLVDCGDYNIIKQKIKDKEIKGVLLTHTHSDHIYGLNELIKDFPNVKIYTNEFGIRALADPQLNISKYHNEIENFIISPKADISCLYGKEKIEIFPNIIVCVIFTPGHDKSCLSYIVDNKLFTGDSFIPSAKLVASFPNSNKAEAKESYNRLMNLGEKYNIYPGHGKNKYVGMKTSQNFYIRFFKRPIGFLGALIALILLSPIFIVTIIVLYFANKGAGVFFYQERPGKDEKIFKAIKFKTMTDERDSDGILLPDSDRLTKVGKFIRSTSIDELPQLINILKGDMAFIGPRPLLVKYLPLYSEEQHRRHDVRPGMSGWAQVNGRNNISWTKKFEYDVYYVEHIGLKLDIKIFFTTIKKVFGRADINTQSGKSATMEAFNGDN